MSEELIGIIKVLVLSIRMDKVDMIDLEAIEARRVNEVV